MIWYVWTVRDPTLSLLIHGCWIMHACCRSSLRYQVRVAQCAAVTLRCWHSRAPARGGGSSWLHDTPSLALQTLTWATQPASSLTAQLSSPSLALLRVCHPLRRRNHKQVRPVLQPASRASLCRIAICTASGRGRSTAYLIAAATALAPDLSNATQG